MWNFFPTKSNVTTPMNRFIHAITPAKRPNGLITPEVIVFIFWSSPILSMVGHSIVSKNAVTHVA